MINQCFSAAILATLAGMTALSAHASEAIISSVPLEGGPSIRSALEATKAAPTPYLGQRSAESLVGKVSVRFHVAADGYPDDIQLLKCARSGALNHQTRLSVARSYCPGCAGQDYTANFDYRE
jgi:outer membrane biosynthesis protein TonB